MNLKIDLHGLSHDEALNKVENVLLVNEVYKYQNVDIVTGKSSQLQEKIINKILKKYNFEYHIPPNNLGVIQVWERSLFI